MQAADARHRWACQAVSAQAQLQFASAQTLEVDWFLHLIKGRGYGTALPSEPLVGSPNG
jgi:hypothetical protein